MIKNMKTMQFLHVVSWFFVKYIGETAVRAHVGLQRCSVCRCFLAGGYVYMLPKEMGPRSEKKATQMWRY